MVDTSTETNNACQICFNINTSVSRIDYQSIQRSALASCPGCALLVSATSHFFPRQSIQFLQLLVYDTRPSQHRGPLLAHVKNIEGSTHALELFRQPRHLISSSIACQGTKELRIGGGIGWARQLSSHSDSPECWKLAKSWLKDCLENHSECPGLETVPLPTRVLFIDQSLKGTESVRLCTLPKGSRGTYTALSHCWGGTVPNTIMLTAASFDRWDTGFATKDLPQTFQDAIRITRELEIQYLWVDTLCIMQDTQDDWARESTKMADIYTNAILTIGADQSSDCHGGILGERSEGDIDVLSIWRPMVSISSEECTCATIYVRRHRGRSYPFLSHSAGKDDGSLSRSLTSGLHSRGWTLQERLLSKRMLHFTPFEMAWECTKEVSCECRLGGSIPKQFLIFRRAFVNPIENWTRKRYDLHNPMPNRAHERLKQMHGPLFQEARGELSSLVQLHWQLNVLEFTARRLTVETDRLTALAGIAHLLCRVTWQEYYFGILSDHLVRGLLWRHKPNPNRKQASRRLPASFAPSWSFGSVTGRVGFVPNPERFALFVPTAVIQHISKKLMSDNPYGSGTGIIDIEGNMVEIRLEEHPEAGVRRDGSVSFTVDFLDPEAKSYPRRYFQPDVDSFATGDYRAAPAYLLILGHCRYLQRHGEQTLGIIVIEVAETGGCGSFRRVGNFSGQGGLIGRNMSSLCWASYGTRQLV